GHILRTGESFLPDNTTLSTACYAAGVFASQLTLGNPAMVKLLSGVRDTLNVLRTQGLRIFARSNPAEPWQLLAMPSAFEMARHECLWRYKHRGGVLSIRCTASADDPALRFEVLADGRALELLVCGEIACGPAEFDHPARLAFHPDEGRIEIRPDPSSMPGQRLPGMQFHVVVATPGAIAAMGGDELLSASGTGRNLPYFAFQTGAISALRFTILGALSDADAHQLCQKYAQPQPVESERSATFWRHVTAAVRVTAADASMPPIQTALDWFARDAIVHLSVPRGLEQANGGAWGVRDVCQGPVEFLLSYEHEAIVAEILRKLFAQQYLRRGDWPQWFMFPPFQDIQSPHCHGDVPVWPLKALCDYLEHTNDPAILETPLPYTDEQTFMSTGHTSPLIEHVDRLLDALERSFLPGVSLPRFGEGDWDDSLQPADPMMRDRLVSAWTCELMYQTLARFAAAMRHFGYLDRAERAGTMARQIEADFRRHMTPDGVVAGFALFDKSTGVPSEYLLHPRDVRTGLHYRLIPMTRGIISRIFTPEQAQGHLRLIFEHLLFPDGARLMDRPTTYTGGRETVFRRSESAAFFGREIGLQYTHAHLRYAEALAVMGRGQDLLRALLVVNPIAVTELVPNARRRQRNTFFSSSDAVFPDRYVATRDYRKLRHGEVATEGGWRIYSSGPGIYTNLVIRHLFGIRRYFDSVEIDPVLPLELNGARCERVERGKLVRYHYRLSDGSTGPKRVTVNGQGMPLEPVDHPYRPGGVRIKASDWQTALQ
ncbi:MAG: cellobiose phosphorylase, partial [Phycisphaerae bacterium]|nr:cellobiose phosphorylase [Phycisphaerae bacterium]